MDVWCHLGSRSPSKNHQKINYKFKQKINRFWKQFGFPTSSQNDPKMHQKSHQVFNRFFIDFERVLDPILGSKTMPKYFQTHPSPNLKNVVFVWDVLKTWRSRPLSLRSKIHSKRNQKIIRKSMIFKSHVAPSLGAKITSECIQKVFAKTMNSRINF